MTDRPAVVRIVLDAQKAPPQSHGANATHQDGRQISLAQPQSEYPLGQQAVQTFQSALSPFPHIDRREELHESRHNGPTASTITGARPDLRFDATLLHRRRTITLPPPDPSDAFAHR